MLIPKKPKHRKVHKGRVRGVTKGGSRLNFGSHGLKALTGARVTSRQIEAARRAIVRHIRRQGKIWIRIFPDIPVSKKPIEVRMGKGKGAPEFWACRVNPGRILFEMEGVADTLAEQSLKLAAAKLPINTKVVSRITLEGNRG